MEPVKLMRKPRPQQFLLLSTVLVVVGVLTAAMGCASRSNTLESMEVSSATISDGPTLPLSVAGHAGGLVNGVPVVAGGNRWSDDKATKRWLHETFILLGDKWVEGPSLPQPLSDAAGASDGRSLFLAGGTDGKTPTDRVLCLSDIASGSSWKQIATLPFPLESAVAEILDGQLYVVTGITAGQGNLSLLRLNLANPTAGWQHLAPFPGPPRSYAASAVIDGQLYVLGGAMFPPVVVEPQVYGDAYRYDVTADKWSRLEHFDFPGYAATAVAVGSRQVLVAGRAPEVGVTSEDIWLIGLETLEKRVIGARTAAGCCFPIIRVADNQYLMPGGEPDTTRSRTARSSIVTLHAR